MHLESLFFLLPSLFSGIWPTTNSSFDFISFQIDNQRYRLLNGSHNISQDIAECLAKTQQLVLFETQHEYNAVATYLKLYFENHPSSSNIILINITCMATPSPIGICYSWVNEIINENIYIYNECSHDCNANCHTYMERNLTHFQLTRGPLEMFNFISYFLLCKQVNHCQTANCSQDCRETDNKYECLCRFGYNLSRNGHSCSDIDECVPPHNHCTDPHQTCVNSQGSFECECISGFEKSDNDACVDIDECVEDIEGKSLCEQDCVNTEGSYKCSCSHGYTLDEDNTTCHIFDECSLGQHQCGQICQKILSSYTCECHPGFQLAEDNHTCDDIDECSSNPHQPVISTDMSKFSNNYTGGHLSMTSRNETYKSERTLNPCQGYCHNIPGSFYCSCPHGFRLAADKSSCLKTVHQSMLCPCSSLTTYMRMNESEPAVQRAIKKMTLELTVPNRETGSFVRRKTSAVDKRGSSVTNSFIAIVFLMSALVLIVLLDISQAMHIFVCKCLNIRIQVRKKVNSWLKPGVSKLWHARPSNPAP